MSCRYNFSECCERLLIEQINMELYASHCYLALAAHFDHQHVALNNIRKYFQKESDGERAHAQLLIDYVNKRGGKVILQSIQAPEFGDVTLLSAFEKALDLEKSVNESLINIHKYADEHQDAQLADFIEGTFLSEQVAAMKELADHITNIKRCTNDGNYKPGEFIFANNFPIKYGK